MIFVSKRISWKRQIHNVVLISKVDSLVKVEDYIKRIQAVSPWKIPFGKGRMEWKRWITQFSRFGKLENFGKLLAKEEEEVQRDS